MKSKVWGPTANLKEWRIYLIWKEAFPSAQWNTLESQLLWLISLNGTNIVRAPGAFVQTACAVQHSTIAHLQKVLTQNIQLVLKNKVLVSYKNSMPSKWKVPLTLCLNVLEMFLSVFFSLKLNVYSRRRFFLIVYQTEYYSDAKLNSTRFLHYTLHSHFHGTCCCIYLLKITVSHSTISLKKRQIMYLTP